MIKYIRIIFNFVSIICVWVHIDIKELLWHVKLAGVLTQDFLK